MMLQAIMEAVRGDPEFEVSIRDHGNGRAVVTLFGPHRPDPQEKGRTRPYIGDIVDSNEGAVADCLRRLRVELLRQL